MCPGVPLLVQVSAKAQCHGQLAVGSPLQLLKGAQRTHLAWQQQQAGLLIICRRISETQQSDWVPPSVKAA